MAVNSRAVLATAAVVAVLAAAIRNVLGKEGPAFALRGSRIAV